MRANNAVSNDAEVVRRSLLISFTQRYVITVMQFVSVIILARLLTPKEIGIYTIGAALLGIAHMIRDFGISEFILQEKELTRKKVGSALSLTIVTAGSAGLLILLSAPYVAGYYNEPTVEAVLRVISLNFFLIPIGAMSPGLLKRDMCFGTLFKIQTSAALTNIVVVLTLAFMGFGPLSMAWASVASTVVTVFLAQYYLPRKFRTWPNLHETRSVIRFGGYVVAANFGKQMGVSLPELIVGSALGFAPLGLFSRASGYLNIYNTLVTKATEPVVHAHLSKMHRADGDFAKSFRLATDALTLLSWPALGLMGLLSHRLILLLYGEQWVAAANAATILCFGAIFAVVNTVNQKALLAKGRADTVFVASMVSNAAKVGLVIGLARHGITAVALAFACTFFLEFVVSTIFVFKTLEVEKSKLLQLFLRNLAILAACMIVPGIIYYCGLVDHSNMLEILGEIALASLGTGLSFALAMFMVDNPIREELLHLTSRIKARFVHSKA